MHDLEQKDALIGHLRNDKDQLRRDCDKHERDTDSCRSSLESAVREKERLNKELMTGNRKLADCEIEIRRLQDDNLQIRKLLNSYEAKIPALEQAVHKHQTNESRFAQEANSAKTSLVRLEKEMYYTTEEKSSLHTHIVEYEGKHEQLTKELEEAYRKIFELEAIHDAAQRTNVDLKRDCDAKIRKLEETLQTSDRANNDIKNQLVELRKRSKSTLEEHSIIQREYEELQHKWNYANSDGTGKDRIIEQLKRDTFDAQNENGKILFINSNLVFHNGLSIKVMLVFLQKPKS